MKSIKYLLILTTLLFVTIQCKKEKPDFPRPEITTGEYNPENGTAIGTISYLSEYVAEYGHIWGTTTPTIDSFLDRSIHTDIIIQDSVEIISNIPEFPTDSTYFIRAYVIDKFGNDWYDNVVIVYSPSDYIKACLTTSHTECETHECGVRFDASCSVGEVATYKWDFNGDNVFDYISDAEIADYTYTTAGTYYPRLYIVNSNNVSSDTIFTLQVYETEQTLVSCFLAGTDTADINTTIPFDASCSRNATYYEWDFDGDGLIDEHGETLTTPTYTYTNPGNFTVKLTVKNTDGITATDSIQIQINPLDIITPTACFFASITEAEAGTEIEFYASCSQDALIYRWDFDGDRDFDMGGIGMQTVTHIFETEGEYEVILEVVSVDNITHSDTITIKINPPTLITPEACITADTTTIAEVGETIYLDASCSQNEVTYKWDFGDGTILNGSQLEVASNSYDVPANYTVTLIVESVDGVQDSDTHTIEINEPTLIRPVACIESGVPSTVEIGETIYFDASCSENAVSYKWNFGDGTIVESVSSLIEHTYIVPDNYVVTLVVKSSDEEESIPFITSEIVCNAPPPEEVTIYPPDMEDICPRHIAGNRDFNSHGPNVTVICEAIFNDSEIYIHVYFNLIQTTDDWTEGQFDDYIKIYDVPNGKKISNILSDNLSITLFEDTDHGADVVHSGGNFGTEGDIGISGNLAETFIVIGDTDGNDVPAANDICSEHHGELNIYFNPITIELIDE